MFFLRYFSVVHNNNIAPRSRRARRDRRQPAVAELGEPGLQVEQPRDRADVDRRRGVAPSRQDRGELARAEPIYRQILAREPAHAEALYLLGLVTLQTARVAEAISLLEQSLAANPQNAEQAGFIEWF